LDKFGTDINSAENGARLTQGEHYGQSLHSDKGIEAVTRLLRQAESKEEAVEILAKIRKQERAGTFKELNGLE
jgi:hypothetical protein